MPASMGAPRRAPRGARAQAGAALLSLVALLLLCAPALFVGPRPSARSSGAARAPLAASPDGRDLSPGDTVVVLGASGNVGKLATLRLLDESYAVRAVVRSAASGERLKGFLGPERGAKVEIIEADAAQSPEGLSAAFQGASAALVCSGTTAFPTGSWAGGGVAADDVPGRTWDALVSNGFDRDKALQELTTAGLNTPEAVNNKGVQAIVAAANKAAEAGTFKRLIHLSSIGVALERRTSFPFSFLNGAGVLDSLAAGEAAIQSAAEMAGYSYTIVRPGRLLGGPYDNNVDLGTLFQLDIDQATRAVELSLGDTAKGDTLRSTCAEVLIQTLKSSATHNADFGVINCEGPPPSVDDIQGQLSKTLS